MQWHTNLRLPEPISVPERRWRVAVDDRGCIAALEPLEVGATASGQDWQGDWLSQAGLDLQINGGLGLPFPELKSEQLPRLLELLDLLWCDGVEAIAPTFVTCGVEPLRQGLAVLSEARRQHRPGRCRLLGAHLEGPFLAPQKRGAHPAEHLCAPSVTELQRRISGFEDDIALVTLAPELPGAEAVIAALRQCGVVVSLGHSAADERAARLAYQQGVGMITHCFNAMAGLHHRAPGPVGALLGSPPVALGVIADGIHIAPAMAALLQRLFPEQVVLVSDALAPYGLPAGTYPWDERSIVVADGTCRLDDRTLAGTTLPLLEGVVRLASWTGAVGAAIRSATVLPRQVLGDQRPLSQQLLGLVFNETLRWHQPSGGPLSWQRNG